MNTQIVEVHLEELGQHSWVLAAFNTLTGTAGSAQYRFVARPPDDPSGEARPRIVGATFPMMRWQDLNNQTEPNGWSEIARDRLAELDRELLAAGWRRREQPGRHWWSWSYTRTG